MKEWRRRGTKASDGSFLPVVVRAPAGTPPSAVRATGPTACSWRARSPRPHSRCRRAPRTLRRKSLRVTLRRYRSLPGRSGQASDRLRPERIRRVVGSWERHRLYGIERAHPQRGRWRAAQQRTRAVGRRAESNWGRPPARSTWQTSCRQAGIAKRVRNCAAGMRHCRRAAGADRPAQRGRGRRRQARFTHRVRRWAPARCGP